MSNQLQIENVRQVLMRLEETILFALIERAQFLRNPVVYKPGHFGNCLDGLSLCEFLLLECERSHAKVRRYTSPDEQPFFQGLPDPILPALGYTRNPLVPNNININDQIRQCYETKILSRITQPGDDEQYGSTAVCDVACLQALSKRIHYGKFVAESKYRAAAPVLQQALESGCATEILAAITDAAVERDVLERVRLKTQRYTNELNQASSRPAPQPEVIVHIYRDFIIPLNKNVQVAYLQLRAGNAHGSPASPSTSIQTDPSESRPSHWRASASNSA